ncbi:MAG: Slp family lipoprotein [Halorhodospira sp.]
MVVLALMVIGCAANPPFERGEAVDEGLTPEAVAASGEDPRDTRVIWAGRILRVEHLEDRTRLELVSYPQDRSQRPRPGKEPQGRFLVDHPGFLESADYRPGRLVTVSGPVETVRTGRVGEQEIRYPVVVTEAVHLWPLEEMQRSGSQVRFGIGVMLSR